MANGFNDFFSNIAGNINSSKPKTSVSRESYLQDYPNLNFEFSPFSQEEHIEIIKSLENEKTVNIDNLSTNILKAGQIEISAPLYFIFIKSMESGVVPKKVKISRTVPS